MKLSPVEHALGIRGDGWKPKPAEPCLTKREAIDMLARAQDPSTDLGALHAEYLNRLETR